MSIRNLDALFHPRSIAVVGASTRANSVGAVVMRNLIEGGFSGPLYPINPKYDSVLGIKTYPGIDAMPMPADLALLCTPPHTLAEIVQRLGRSGTRAAIVLTPALRGSPDEAHRTLTQAILEAAKPHLLRILGPNSIGLLSPAAGLNASMAHAHAARGNLAFVSQSGALATAVLDRANSRGIGFAHFVSLGEGCDVDVGDLIDYFGSDAHTRALLIYLESIHDARKFMSAARAAARNKPLIVVKAGRGPRSANMASFHTGALAGTDDVFDAAIRRAGMLRVDTMRDLFAAVETLAHITKLNGERLAIMANGGGAAIVAADAAHLEGVKLAELAPQTRGRLDAVLPGPSENPLNLGAEAPAARYVDTLAILAEDPGTDAIVFVHTPSALADSDAVALACAPAARAAGKPVLSCWLGGDALAAARARFHEAGIADYATPEEAVRAFSQLVTYRKNQQQLLETPVAAQSGALPDRAGALRVIDRVLAAGRDMLTEPEAKSVLAAYGIPVVETRTAASPEAAAATAEVIGFPVAVKIVAADVAHKSQAGGVALGLESAADVRAAAQAMQSRLSASRPEVQLAGFSVQSMAQWRGAHELIAGASVDPVFGPVILFGQGGTDVELIADRAIGLPPLNVPLARELVARTRVGRLLADSREPAHADLDAVYDVLQRLSQMVVDIAQIVDVDVNPLLVHGKGVLALDARMRVAPSSVPAHARLAIRPYPAELEERIDWDGRSLWLRPVRPEDTRQHLRFLQRLSPHDVRMRLFHTKRYIAPSELARLTQIDYEREMAFIATARAASGGWETLGVVRVVTDPENARAEFAIIVRSDIKGKGLGRLLLDKIIRYCRSRGTEVIVGDVLKENSRMLELTRQLGFTVTASPEPGTMQATLVLHDAQPRP